MCRPLHFSSLDYVINPWMQPSLINQSKAMQQWNALVETCEKLGMKVEIIDQIKGLPDMVFTTNEGIVYEKNKVLLSKFRYKERQGETPYFEQWFKDHNFEITYLPKELYLEGNGSVFFWNDKLFVGVGYRTDKQACQYLQKLFPSYEVVELYATAPAFYHLNISFFPLDKQTIFYYPEAFKPEGREALKKMVPNLIPLNERQMKNFCANSVVSGNTVIHQIESPLFSKQLKELGYKSVEVDLSEFKKSGGGTQCLINILDRG
jgi:N-dimethylarginine dimethylaminohydrolase